MMRPLTPCLMLLLAACFDEDCPGDEASTADTQVATAALSCADIDRAMEGETTVPTDEAEITLSGVYRVSDTVTFDSGEVVTIEPGTVFLMEAGALLRFGWRSDPAAVFANGTADAPILFCGTADEPGHWVGVELLTGTREDSELRHVVIEDAGLDEAPALHVTTSVDLVSVDLVDNAASGLYAEALGEDSDDLWVTGNDVGVHLLNGETITRFPEGDYTGNADDVVLVTHIDNEDAVFHDRGVPYRQTDDRVVYGSAGGEEIAITYEAGVVYELCQDCNIIYGWRSDEATVQALGTPEAPVVFTSANPTPRPGDWDGLTLATGTTSASRFENTLFEFGGKAGGEQSNGANVIVNGGLGSLVDCTFADSAGYGLWLESVEPGFVEEGSLFIDNGEGDVFED